MIFPYNFKDVGYVFIFFITLKTNMEDLVLSCIESRVENNRSLYSRFQIGPFNRGQGVTVANAMRRTLLSELSGLSIICVEINGVSHEYSNIRGVRESVLDILLNLKQLVFVSDKKFNQPEIGFLKLQGPGIVKASDLKLPSFLQCVDPDQYIATLSYDGILEMKCMICKGKNFLVQTSFELIEKTFQLHFHSKNKITHFVSENKQSKDKFNINGDDKSNITFNKLKKDFQSSKIDFQKFEKNLNSYKNKTKQVQNSYNLAFKKDLKRKTSTNILFIDAVFMPVTKVNFSIQNVDSFSRLKDSTLENKFTKNYLQEKIILEIWTNGSIHPRQAIQEAAQELITIFIPFQKISSYKKTNSFIKPIILNQSLSSTGLMNTKPLISSVELKTKSYIEKVENNTNLTPTLNKIYRPWKTKLRK